MDLTKLWPERMVSLDTESTGTRDAEMLQFSAIDGWGNVLLDTYIRPLRHKKWEHAEAVNGISPAMVRHAAPLSAYKDQIEEILFEADVLIGYALQNDLVLLSRCGIRLPKRLLYLDPAITFSEVYAKECGKVQLHRLSVCAEYYGYKGSGWHNSLCDAEAALFCAQAQIRDGSMKDALLYAPKPKRPFIRHRQRTDRNRK